MKLSLMEKFVVPIAVLIGIASLVVGSYFAISGFISRLGNNPYANFFWYARARARFEVCEGCEI